MNAEELTKLADQLSSSDLTVSRGAAKDLRAALSPARLVAAWQDEEQRAVLERLLQETESVGDTDVYGVVASALETALATAETWPALLAADAAHTIPTFLFKAIASNDIGVAYRVRPAVLTLMRSTSERQEGHNGGGEIGHLIDTLLDAEKALRLFDCDAVECEDNLVVYSYLKRFTSRISAIITATLAAFDTDPLLLANYLVVSGIISQREIPTDALVSKVEAVLDAHEDDLYVAFVSRYCSITLFHKERSAVAHADRWVRAAFSPSLLDSCSEDTLDSVLDLAGSASTTQSGWRAVVSYLPVDWLSTRLRSRSAPIQLSSLRFLRSVLLSPYLDPSALPLVPLLREAWQLRSSLEEPIRMASWEVARAAVGNHFLRDQLAASYASFLAGVAREESVAVRELQLKVANILSTCDSNLPEATKLSLAQFNQKGLYPPGSAGVAEMTKD